MTDLEQRPEPPPPAPPPPEPWSATWSWAVRLIGAALVIKQGFFDTADRQWLLLVAMALMMGEVGIKALLRFLLKQAEGR